MCKKNIEKNMHKQISGFSKLSKQEKINWITTTYFSNSQEASTEIQKYWNSDLALQKLHDEFAENTITNFYLPFSVAPNFKINNQDYIIPMVTEESSVVAAVSKAAKFWSSRGGFKTTVIDIQKNGQVHFIYKGNPKKLQSFFLEIKDTLIADTNAITANMNKRGGGILEIELRDKTEKLANYYQLHATFDTKDSMGANFINSCLEQFAKTLQQQATQSTILEEKNIEIIMSILSNYVPNCTVRAEVSCPIEELSDKNSTEPHAFAVKFAQAVTIAEIEPFRAVTHNKGIMNGVDAVVIATGNDFRAIEAGVHAYASRFGNYSSLSHVDIQEGVFKFWIEIPLALGTVGGLTNLHPLVKIALKMLKNPSATQLMQIIASVGLAQNFAAIKSLTTTGIQQGHMKMHLTNILNQYSLTDIAKQEIKQHFESQPITHAAVVNYIQKNYNL